MKKEIDFKTLTRKQIAEALGKSERTITNWRQEGCPHQNGKYSLPAMVDWLLARQADDMDAGNGDNPNLERYRAARAKLAELELERKSGELVSVQEVRASAFSKARQIRDAFQSMPTRLCDQLVTLGDRHAIQQLLDSEIYQILMALSGPAIDRHVTAIRERSVANAHD